MQDDVEGTGCGVDMSDLAAPFLGLVDGAGMVVPNVPKEIFIRGLQVRCLDPKALEICDRVGPEKRSGFVED